MGKVVQADEALVRSLWFSDLRNDELADAIGVHRGSLYTLRERYGLPLREQHCLKGNAAHKSDPTAEEIEQRAAECRAKWSREEEARRWLGGRRGYEFPRYAYDGRSVVFSGMDG